MINEQRIRLFLDDAPPLAASDPWGPRISPHIIGTAAALIGMGIASAVGGVASGVIGSKAAGKAAGIQSQATQHAADLEYKASQEALAFQKKQYEDAQALQKPWIEAGTGALGTLTTGTAEGGEFAKGFDQPFDTSKLAFDPSKVSLDPGFEFRLKEGQKALERSAAARGGALGGRAAKELTRYAQDYSSNEYSNAYNRAFAENQVDYNRKASEYERTFNIFEANRSNRLNPLMSLAGAGQTATSQLNSSGLNFANAASTNVLGTAANVGDLLTQGANARAAGVVGGANAWQNALSGISSSAQNALLMSLLTGGGKKPANPPWQQIVFGGYNP